MTESVEYHCSFLLHKAVAVTILTKIWRIARQIDLVMPSSRIANMLKALSARRHAALYTLKAEISFLSPLSSAGNRISCQVL